MAYLIMVLAFLISIFCVYSIPSELLKDNIYKSELLIINEGENDCIWNIKFLRKDNFTDGTMYNILASAGKEDSFQNSLLNPRATDTEGLLTPAEAGYKVATGDVSDITYWNYSRYWHGYLVPLSIMTIFIPLSYLRIFNNILLWILFIITAFLMMRKTNWKFSLCFLFASACICFPSVAYSLQYSTCFYITYIFTILILICKKIKIDDMYVLCFIIGGLTSFLDFLTTPIICLGIPLLTYNALNNQLNTRSLINMILIWLVGYCGIWAAKWIIATCLTSENIIIDALASAKTRSTLNLGIVDYAYKKTIGLICFMIITPIILVYAFLKRYKRGVLLTRNDYYTHVLIIGLLPIIWYILFWNHSSVHFWFTWRSLYVSSMSAFLLFFNIDSISNKTIHNA